MRLTKINIQNFRSIKKTGDIAIEPLQALVGENNCGKSNLLRAIQCFLSSGAGGMDLGDFNDPTMPAVIECEFAALSADERKRLRPYLLGDKVILRKELAIVRDETRDRTTVKADFHGYQAEPKDNHLSIAKLEAEADGRVKWKEIAEAAGFLDHVQDAEGKVNKTTYVAGVNKYLAEHEVDYETPVLGETQALGIPQNLLATLPEFFLLPAITDYSDEVGRSSTTVFRRLMADLADRIMSADPRYKELEDALTHVRALLNTVAEDGAPARLDALGGVEDLLRDIVKKLMPTVQSVRLGVEVDASRDIFSKGVTIRIDDGVLTDVIDKGHGMQRSLVFSLLQMLIKAGRAADTVGRPILLAIEEPELYIHPHCQRLIFRVLREFAGIKTDDTDAEGTDQVIYATHSPAFVEVGNYERIGVVRKPDLATGTIVRQAAKGVLGSPDEKKAFKVLTSFGLKHNEVFFARDAIIVEGPEDEVGIIATARKLGRIEDLPEEAGVSIVVTHGKGDIPKFQKVLNAFGLGYGVLLELDGHDDAHPQTAPILAALNGNRVARVPHRLEQLVGVAGHFEDQRHAKLFFSDPANINAEMEAVVTTLLPPH